MRLLFGYENEASLDLQHPGPNVSVRALDLESFDAASCAYLRQLAPDVLVLRLADDDLGVVQRWLRGMLERNVLRPDVHVIGLRPASSRRSLVVSDADDAYQLTLIGVPPHASGERMALRYAESVASQRPGVWLSCLPRHAGSTVVLVGCGVVNLITAVHLLDAGYRVTIVESGPPPDTATSRPRCTWSGGDGRIFSWNEARHHLRGRSPQAASRAFRMPITEGGWLCARPEALTPADRRWIDSYDQTAPWLRDVYNDDIIAMNRDSAAGWLWLNRTRPSLFANVGFQDRLFRIYPTLEKQAKAEIEERGIGAFKRRVEQLAVELPSLASAAALGNVRAAIEVQGFGLNIHRFGRALVQHVQAEGAQICWNTPIDALELDPFGNVEGVWSGSRLFEADHFVVSPGVAGAECLKHSLSGPQIAAMLGVWVSLPRPADAKVPPIKVARDGFASDESAAGANVIPGYAADGSPIVHISAGHGFLGENVDSADPQEVHAMFRAVEDTAASLFPDWFRAAQASGQLLESRASCIRPWTPTCLGLFETRATSTGGVFVVAGGHNTGGFAQAPQVAQAVLAALEGRAHPMHRMYHPERLSTFLQPSPTRGVLAFERAS